MPLKHLNNQNSKSTMNKIKSLIKAPKDILPPIALKKPKVLELFNDRRIDNYYWMRLSDRQKEAEIPDNHTQTVLNYLNAENDYTKAVLKHTEEFQEELFHEIIGRIKQTDMSVPYLDNGYFYTTKYEEGKEYPLYIRSAKGTEKEELLIDVNQLAKGYSYYDINSRSVSPNNKILAYGEDSKSRRQYTIKFKNLNTNKLLNDTISNTSGSAVWANDNKTVFYTRKDHALRPYKIFKHVIGTNPKDDEEIYHESDETFRAFVYKTKSKKFIIIGSWSTLTQEYRYIDADRPDNGMQLFQARIPNLEYEIDHYDDHWYIRTNKDKAINYKIMSCQLYQTSIENWKNIIEHRDDVLIEGIDIFKDYMVLTERVKGITKIRIISWKHTDDHYIDFSEEAYLAYTDVNKDFDSNILRVGFTSLTTPNSTYDYDVKNRQLKLLKQQEVVGDFDPEDYSSERVMVKARDGKEIPLSIVHHKNFQKNGKSPVLLYGYGSYGNSMDPYFSSVRLSLLNRGFAFAIAHIRGGQELGRRWYEDGKLLKKKNTFYDFIDCGHYLVEKNYVSPDQLYAMGGSAGGLLMGAVMNMAPELWSGVIAAVPFVDVVTTMLDESIPLTTGEFDEWGNPKVKEYYDYIRSYSPYENIDKKDYPPTLVTTGLHDSQVQYWEPAKWVAKLREMKTDNNILLLHTNMEAGHGGASGRFRRYREVALEYTFLLLLAGKI